MEINDPRTGAVSNGLLVVEMVGNQQKLGDHPADSSIRRHLIDAPVAGDPIGVNYISPRYNSFVNVATINDPSSNRDPERLGQTVDATLDYDGNQGSRGDLASAYVNETTIVQYNIITGHNIPRIFWDFLNQSGPIYLDGRVQNGPIIAPRQQLDDHL